MNRVIIVVVGLMLLAGCDSKTDNAQSQQIQNLTLLVEINRQLCKSLGESIMVLEVIESYDPNDQALRYLSKPPAEWAKEHGDSERSLLLYNLAATSVIAKEALRSVGVVSRCVVKVHPSFVVTKDDNQIMDPNNYMEVKE